MRESQDWWVITLSDRYEPYGGNIAALLDHMRTDAGVTCALVDNLEGPGIQELEWCQADDDSEYVTLELDSLIPLMRCVYKLEWGDILCYGSQDEIPDLRHMSNAERFGTSRAAVRIADDSIIDVFTTSMRVYQSIMDTYGSERCYFGRLVLQLENGSKLLLATLTARPLVEP